MVAFPPGAQSDLLKVGLQPAGHRLNVAGRRLLLPRPRRADRVHVLHDRITVVSHGFAPARKDNPDVIPPDGPSS
jgi:hypothetical protein